MENYQKKLAAYNQKLATNPRSLELLKLPLQKATEHEGDPCVHCDKGSDYAPRPEQCRKRECDVLGCVQPRYKKKADDRYHWCLSHYCQYEVNDSIGYKVKRSLTRASNRGRVIKEFTYEFSIDEER